MNPYELSIAMAALANTIACKLNDDDLALVISIISQLKDNLVTIAAQRRLLGCSNDSTGQEADEVLELEAFEEEE